MAAPVAPLVLAASALGFGLWWFWPAQKTGAADKPDGGGGGGGTKGPTAEQTAAAKVKGAADGCARGTADAKAGKTPAQATADLGPGGKDNAAWIAAANASGDPDAYFDAYEVSHKTCFDTTAASMTKAMPLPTKYTVTPSDTPATVAGRFGITVDRLLTFNGYGHGEDPVKNNTPYPYGAEMGAFTSAFGSFAGTTFTPTWQAGHKATANLRPIFRSSKPFGGQWYWWFPAGASPTAAPGSYAPNDSGFGRIYRDGGTFLVGPWYAGLVLSIPVAADAGAGALALRGPERAAREAPVATGFRVGNTAIVGARRAPVDVDQMHAGMARHFSPRSRLGWPAPPDDVDDGDSTLYRSY